MHSSKRQVLLTPYNVPSCYKRVPIGPYKENSYKTQVLIGPMYRAFLCDKSWPHMTCLVLTDKCQLTHTTCLPVRDESLLTPYNAPSCKRQVTLTPCKMSSWPDVSLLTPCNLLYFTDASLLPPYKIGSPLEPWILWKLALGSVLHLTFLQLSGLSCRRWPKRR